MQCISNVTHLSGDFTYMETVFTYTCMYIIINYLMVIAIAVFTHEYCRKERQTDNTVLNKNFDVHDVRGVSHAIYIHILDCTWIGIFLRHIWTRL